MKINKKRYFILDYRNFRKWQNYIKKILKFIKKNYGSTIILSGDDLRHFSLNKYSLTDRKIALSYSKFCKKITNQGINVIFATVSMFHKSENITLKISKTILRFISNLT